MSRPMLLAFLLLVLIITSQLEWKQPLLVDPEPTPSISEKQYQISERQEAVKEKIILSQEKNIQKLNELVQSLRRQLLQCRADKETRNNTVTSLTEQIIELERQQILED
ncbi:uncharacterized protein LOC116210879 [Punica granatum]|uniref:Uncharacterized protein n=2 Tax=Punica granatum TaxID=22663 RepID=A0A218W8Q2_PUNGR|nr:uncharacterized protein LOC116210879 [Punica granatum]OWM69026.1 hypothetical protein CDL15_Pgr025213 [Punica granatum]PKI73381.1 hypothetical protein CRG98_006319 [Punica granatum]